MPVKHHALTWKRNLFLLLLLVVGLSVAMPVYYIYKKAKAMMIEQTQMKASNIAFSVSAFLSYNIGEYRPLSDADVLVEGSELERTYHTFNAILREIKSHSDATFIYTSKYLNDKTSVFILDGEDPKSVLFSPFGSRDTMDPSELQTLLEGEPTVTKVVDDSVWGTYLSAYVPIQDSTDGSIVGLVGVDYSEDNLLDQYKRFAWVLNLSFTLFTLLITVSLYALIVTVQNRSGIDDLTKLGNKQTFLKELHATLEEAKKYNQNFVLCMLDVDSFKAINDTYGHPVGDGVLRCIGLALSNALDKTKGCYRYGGDEFAVILPNTTFLQAQEAKKSMQEEISAIDISDLKGMMVSASIGMAEWLPGIKAETLIELADKDLYVQKLRHKNELR